MKNLFLNSILTLATDPSLNPVDLVAQAGWVVKAVMILLILASIISWTIIFWKWWGLRNAAYENSKFTETFWASGSLKQATIASKSHAKAPVTRVFDAGVQEFNQVTALGLERDAVIDLLESNVTRSLDKATRIETSHLQRYLPFLATTASSAPFIGLFGTVWGIMTSFINIGATGASNLAVVAPGIAEALIATAMGLFAAIPAGLFYNFFVGRIKEMSMGMNYFVSDFMNTAKRSL